ncbi:MAG: Co2+/Mg2+ efflux protein ApaG [Pseudomonadota bacterium]
MYSEITRSIRVSVEPFFVHEQSEPHRNRYVFGYKVRIRNDSDGIVQLISRHWHITDGSGRRYEVRGEGVVGEQPFLEPGESFEYTSGAPLRTPSGFMSGSYVMQGKDGLYFDVRIPAFSLDAPGVGVTLN